MSNLSKLNVIKMSQEEKIKIINSDVNQMDLNLNNSGIIKESKLTFFDKSNDFEIQRDNNVTQIELTKSQKSIDNSSNAEGLVKDTFKNNNKVKKDIQYIKKDLNNLKNELGQFNGNMDDNDL